MQGQRGAMGSLPETLDIDRASSSGSAEMSHQLCWTDLRSQSESHFHSLMLPPPTDSLRPNWPVSSPIECSGSSSSCPGNSIPEWKLGGGLPSSSGLAPHPESRAEPAITGDFAPDGTSASPVQIQRRNPPSLNLNGRHNSDKSPYVCPMDQMADVGGNISVMQEEINSARVGSSAMRVRCVPCKRKCLEGHSGQSSTNPESHFHQNMLCDESHAIPAFFSVNGGSLPQEPEPRQQQTPGIQVPVTGSGHLPNHNVQGRVEDLGRNLRLRMFSSQPMSFSSALALQNSIPSTSQPSGFSTVNHAVDPHSLLVSSGVVAAHRPTVVFNAPASVYARHSSASVSGNVGSHAHNPVTSGRSTRIDLGYPVLAMGNGSGPPIQNSGVRRGTADGNGALPGNAVYSSGSQLIPSPLPISQPSNPNVVPLDPVHHAQYLQINSRGLLAEYARQALMASPGLATGSESSLASHGHGGPIPAQDTTLLTGLVNRGRRRSASRSSHLMERQVDSMAGGPYLRHVTPLRDDRRRRLAELQNVMESMRRGQALRFEDIMLLHQSALLRVANLHDRHRDLRLDVDNMSYEELLALEERIGSVSTGLNEETIMSQLKQHKVVDLADREGEVEPCCICQEEYVSGEDIGTLDCGHEFHTGCIKQWLTYKNLCPICKKAGLAT
ncbi:hypothetical protein MLD38_034461 [Melastoma candidum]|uniref:Uncharacterized protein n=1 Tax=Melastoma candidum TaxID=119954 RepID=A0ACB9MAH2_9MYRT|nr:hypothetical protein MLD38_034461 [Melastoma candidum]